MLMSPFFEEGKSSVFVRVTALGLHWQIEYVFGLRKLLSEFFNFLPR